MCYTVIWHVEQKSREVSDNRGNWLECVQPASYMETKVKTGDWHRRQKSRLASGVISKSQGKCLTLEANDWVSSDTNSRSALYCHLTCEAKVKGGVWHERQMVGSCENGIWHQLWWGKCQVFSVKRQRSQLSCHRKRWMHVLAQWAVITAHRQGYG